VSDDNPVSMLQQYEDGLPGWIYDPRAQDEFFAGQRYQHFNEPNIRGMGLGKRAMLYAYARALDARCFTEEQTTSDCTSHGSRNARDMTRATQILVDRAPHDWFRVGATEPTYGARGHGGAGMSPARAARFERDVGFLYRTDYPGVVNLTKYTASHGIRWGEQGGPPQNVRAECAKNRVGLISLVRTQEELMDAMINGYAAHSGQYAAWSGQSDSRGIYPRVAKGWNHDMAIAFYDDTKEFYPFRVWGIVNSWGSWNQKPKFWPSAYPEWVPGMIVTTAEDFDVCLKANDCWVYGKVDGYPPQKLPDYGAIGMLKND
jgi:hypothetical protein